MSTVVGIGGARRNAAAALCIDGRIVAVCEQERVTRVRRAGLTPGELPLEAVDSVLAIGCRERADVSVYAVAEVDVDLPRGLPVTRVDHHLGHAATAFWSSPFEDAVVLVCDRHGVPSLTVWRGDRNGLAPCEFPWDGPGLAGVYSETAEAFFGRHEQESELEALARAGTGASTHAAEALIAYRGNRLELHPDYASRVAEWSRANDQRPRFTRRAEMAGGFQRHIGNLLITIVQQVKTLIGGRHLCITGGLFFNSYLTTVVSESGIYERTFVPVNPGNAGVPVGAALAASGRPTGDAPLSPFLGPEYDPVEIKSVLDNCKLSYDYVSDGDVITEAVNALARGQMVGWFQGRMEWGVRALGNRSILANPSSPYTLENLNFFLKKREPHRAYSVSVCLEDAATYFEGPPESLFMEFDYSLKTPGSFRTLMPQKATPLRVQTVDKEPQMLRSLLKAFGTATGTPVLVNTSFNGFQEPIVCTPRDAVRVFYGTGLDIAIIGNFVLRK
jgi:carbamoyltransferase